MIKTGLIAVGALVTAFVATVGLVFAQTASPMPSPTPTMSSSPMMSPSPSPVTRVPAAAPSTGHGG